MRRKDRERDEAFAWAVLEQAPYATLSLTDRAGVPYAVPLCQAADSARQALYFHCARAGEKWELLKDGAEVCLTAVSRAESVPGEFTMAYASAVARGRAEVVTEPEEKHHALRLLCQRFDPEGMEHFDVSMEQLGNVTQVVRITIQRLTAKENCAGKEY